HLGKAMNSPLTLQNITYWKAHNYFDCKSTIKRKSNVLLLSSLGKIMESLLSMKIEVAHERLANSNFLFDEIEQIMKRFLPFFYELCCKTYIKYEYDLHEDTENELKEFCQKLLKPKENVTGHILSIFFTATLYKSKNSYKFIHQIDQEFGYAKFLGQQLLKQVNCQELEKELLKHCIIWNYLFEEKDLKNAIMNIKPKINRFGNVLLFLIGEITKVTREASKNDIFKLIANRIIDLVWFSGDIMIPKEIGNEISKKEVVSPDNLLRKNYHSYSEQTSLYDEPLDLSMSSLQAQLEGPSVVDQVLDVVSSASIDTGMESKEMDNHKEDKYTYVTQCQEDGVLMAMMESDYDIHINKAVFQRLFSKENWVIMNPVCLPALNKILKELTVPRKIKISIDTDPLMFTELEEVLNTLKMNQMQTSLHFKDHYLQFFEGKKSDKYIDKGLCLMELMAKLSNIGIERLPNTLTDLYISIDIEEICMLNKKLKELKDLKKLDLKVEVRHDCGMERIQNLCFYKDVCIIVVVEHRDVNVCKAAHIVAKLQPLNHYTLRDLSFQNTSYSYEDIAKLIRELKDAKVKLLGSLKIWSSEIIEDKKVHSLNKAAYESKLGGFVFYRSLDLGMPDLLIDQSQILKELSQKLNNLKN
ncbi:unnamed protein product, partial [Meganyctiphanes norvegica]